MNKNQYCVIIAGGSGERFWPISTTERPKQFLKLFGGKSLLRQAAERAYKLVPRENLLVVTAANLAKATGAELPELAQKNILLEPCRKNTGPAIASALGVIRQRAGESALVAVLTADQLITRPAVFRQRLKAAFAVAAHEDVIVTLGIKPTWAATGYGYINAKKKQFVEKPDAATAAKYLRSGNYLWNAGMFIFRTGALQQLCRTHAPELAALSDRLCATKRITATMARLYPKLTSISFDYAVMEKTRAIEVVAGDFGWDDVGSFAALSRHFPRDAQGNVRLGAVRSLDCTDCSFVGEGVRISALGLKDLVVATHGNEVLVMSQAAAAELKKLLAE